MRSLPAGFLGRVLLNAGVEEPSSDPSTIEGARSEASLGRATLGLVAITLVVKLFGFGEKQVIAYYFGADFRVDAFFVALSVPMALFLWVRELIEPAFLPLFVGHMEANEPGRGWRLVALVGIGVVSIVAPLALLGGLLPARLAAVLAPGFDAAGIALTARLLEVVVVASVFLGLSSLTYITLNGYRRFVLPASGDIVLRAFPMMAAVLFASQLGIFALAVGFVAGALGRLIVHLVGLQRVSLWPDWSAPARNADLRALWLLIAPLLLGAAFAQVSELADNFFSSGVGSGALSARIFARKIIDLPIVLIPYALSVVVFPHFASLAYRGETEALFGLLGRTLRGLAVVFALLGVVSALLAEPLVTLLLERGAFDEHARQMTAWPLKLYAAGLVTFALEAILVPFYFALRDTKTPIFVGIAGVIVNIGLARLLIAPMGVGGVALALTISKTLKLVVLAVLLRRKRAGTRLGPAIASAGRLAIASAIAGGSIQMFVSRWPFPGPESSIPIQVGYLASAALVGAALFVGTLLCQKSPERALIVGAWRWGRALLFRRGPRSVSGS